MSNEYETGKLKGLHHALYLVHCRKLKQANESYLAAVNDIEVFILAAIERVENGEPMEATCETTTVAPPS